MILPEQRFALRDLFLESYKCAEDVQWRFKYGGTMIIFRQFHGEYLKVHITDDGIHYEHDPFPAPKRAFLSNIPTTTLDEFESDLRRMNIPIPKRKVIETHA